jgi:hypothetical protein
MIAAEVTSADLLSNRGICGTEQRTGSMTKGNPRQKVAPMLFETKTKAEKEGFEPSIESFAAAPVSFIVRRRQDSSHGD